MHRFVPAILVVGGCQLVFDVETKQCTENADCLDGVLPGTCDCGACSFPDAACAASSRRWTADARGNLASACVPIPDQLDARVFHTCATMSDGTARCWGFNSEGQLGANQPLGTDSNLPVEVRTSDGNVLRDIVEIKTGAGSTCARFADTTVGCWGGNSEGQLGAGLPIGMGQLAIDPRLVTTGATPLTNVTALTVGYFHACARVGTDEVYCWGNNDKNQVGPGAEIKSNIAVKVALPAGVVGAISSGGQHSCANVSTTTDGRRTFCWGRTADGRLGNLTLADGASTPVLVVQDTGQTRFPDGIAIAAGNSHTCAIKSPFAEVYCWGNNSHGELGNNSTTSVAFASLIISNGNGEASVIGTGDAHTCAAVDDTVRCWGIDADGEVGNGDDEGADKLVPVRTATLASRQIGLTTGHAHTCSLGLDRVVHCWGLNDHGELGNGDTVPRTSPTPLSPLAFCPRVD